MHTIARRALVGALLLTAGITIGKLAALPRAQPRLPLSDFVGKLDSDSIERVSIDGETIDAVSRRAGSFRTYAPAPYAVTLIPLLLDRGVTVEVEPGSLLSRRPWIPIVPVLILQGLLCIAAIRTRVQLASPRN